MLTRVSKKGWKWPTDNQPVDYVDEQGITWYRLDCRYQFGDWIETHDRKLWKMDGLPHKAMYWVHERLYGWILLKGV